MLTMKDIRILPICVDGYKITDEDMYERFPIDRNRFRIVVDRDNPEYLLVVISHVLYRKNVMKEFKHYYSSNRIIIFEGDEAISPDMNIFDYAITYDDSMTYEDRVCHRPFSMFVAGGSKILHGNQMSHEEAQREYDRRKFCNFIYSNSKAFHARDKLYYEISNYKRIDSLGKHLNNMKNNPDRESDNWFASSVDVKHEYRFSICAENGRMSGYTSEKIISAFLAGSVPIYWGNPNVVKEFNPKAFVNCNDTVGVLEKIRKIDENRDMWVEMASAQWQTDEQRIALCEQEKKYIDFINHIFDQDIGDAKRCPTTTAACFYVNFIKGCIDKTII